MGRIPLEDNYDDVIKKAQRGLGITDEELARRAEVSVEELISLKEGKFHEAVARRVAGHLHLHRENLVQLARKSWYPAYSPFTTGFLAFNTPFDGGSVNNYLIWDERSRHAAIFDTGMTADPVLDAVRTERLQVRYIFLTHAHEDHIADLEKLVRETKAEVWISSQEPIDFTPVNRFNENAFFHVGPFSVKTLFTSGHSPGGATYFITGLSYPLAIAGDSIFSSSMGGAPKERFAEAVENNRKKILNLPADTVIACGHGPVTTVRQERMNNPFFTR